MWSVGANPNGPTKFVPGRINWPVSCGGVTVNPGDLIVGDADGITVVEREKVASLLPLASKKVAAERQRIAEITGGGAIRPPWLEAALVAAGLLSPERRPGADLLAWSAVHGLAMLVIDGPLASAVGPRMHQVGQRLLDMVERGL